MSVIPVTDPAQHRLCIGLTGGIGCGKSTVARLFEELGAVIIDTDAIAHQLTQPGGQAIAPVRSSFGEYYITSTGAMDRTRMRHLVFSDRSAKSKLENILHPLILSLCLEQLQVPSCAPYTLLMAPLLLECPPYLQLVQRVLLVDCSEQNQISRTMQRSRLDESEIRAIIALQLSQTERRARADDIIQNDNAIDALTAQVAVLHQDYLNINNNHLTAS
ncbi:MAG: dephospho-CoA kinase [Gallionella sp.]|jgi:dephospho-CoA kinase